MPDSLIASVRFDADGLVPAIAQDTHSDMVEGFNDCLKKIKSKLRNKKDT